MNKQEILKKADRINKEREEKEKIEFKKQRDDERYILTCNAAHICSECGEDVSSVKGTQKKEGRIVLMEKVCKSCNCVTYQEYIRMDKGE